MAKLKEKIEREKKSFLKKDTQLDAKQTIPEGLWQKEIESLQAKRFSSIEEASSELILRVVERIGGDAEIKNKMKDFLLDVIETDPGLQNELKKVLKIG